MFDLSLPKLLVLAVIALVIFGPNELPQIASQAGRALRDLRTDRRGREERPAGRTRPGVRRLRDRGPESQAVRPQHLLGDPDADQAAQQQPAPQAAAKGTPLTPDELPAIRTCFSEFIITNRTGSPDHGGTR